jgi:aminocarboxymuconate-semialdehyde decarboxylase
MIVDFHNHFIPRSFPERPDGLAEPSWPRLEPQDGGGVMMYVGDKPFRAFDDIYWDVDKRLAAMDRAGTDVQVICALPELFSYWLDPQAGIILADAMNRACAEMVAAGGGRIRGLGILALQAPEEALRQIEQIAGFGLSGLFLGSHVNGISIASERFHPVMAAAERLGLPIFVHGIKPGGLERIEGPALMGAVIGVPYEGTMALTSFMATDILGRFPDLKLVFAHGGGMIGSIIDRMELVWNRFPAAMQTSLTQPPTEYARRFWYDTVVFSAENVSYLARRFGADRIVAGTDGPTEIGQTDLPAFIAATGLSPTDQRAILGGNALRLLGTEQ